MIMKTKVPTALKSSLLLATLACPVLAVPVDDFIAGTPLGATAIPSSFGVDTVLDWWLTGAFTACPLGTLLTFLLVFCICALIASRPPSTRGPRTAACSATPASRRVARS